MSPSCITAVVAAFCLASSLAASVMAVEGTHLPPGVSGRQAAQASPGQDDVISLVSGARVERELQRGQRHNFLVTLASGDYLRVIVDQQGIDVVVSLYGPDGEQLRECDAPSGTRGSERVFVIAKLSGTYRLQVRSLAVNPLSGRYQASMEISPSPGPQDRFRVAAQDAVFEGARIEARATASSRQAAILKYREAAEHWRLAGDTAGEADALIAIAMCHYAIGDVKTTLDLLMQTRPLVQAPGDRGREAFVLVTTALLYHDLGDNQKSLESHNESLSIVREIGDRGAEAIALGNIGLVYDALGNKQKALDYYTEALLLRRAIGEQRGEAATLNNIGRVYADLGDSQRAMQYYEQALPLRRAARDTSGEANTLHSIGAIYHSQGHHRRALDYYNQSLSLARTAGDRSGEATVLTSISRLSAELGDHVRAVAKLNQVLALKRAVNDRRGEAVAFSNVAWVHAAAGQHREALEKYYRALTMSRAVGDRRLEATILYGMARLERKLGDLSKARVHIESALNLSESQRADVVSHDLRESFFASVRGFYDLYIQVLMEMHTKAPLRRYDLTAFEVSERARARSLLEFLAESTTDIRQGVDPVLLDRERALLQLLTAKYERFVRLNDDSLTNHQATEAKREIEKLATEFKELQAEIRSKSPRYAALTQPQPLKADEIQQQVLDSDSLLLEYALGDDCSYLWALSRTTLRSFKIPKRASIESAAERVYNLLMARVRKVKGETSAQRKARIARADSAYPRAALSLSRMLLGPVADQLAKKRLIIVSDGMLHHVSFAALPVVTGRPAADGRSKEHGSRGAPYRPLIADSEIVNLPSASTMAVLRRELAGRPVAAKAAAALVDPVFESTDLRVKSGGNVSGSVSAGPEAPEAVDSLERSRLTRALDGVETLQGRVIPRLPYSKGEADVILKLVPIEMRKVALGFDANYTTATDPDLANYQIIHFGTHSLLNDRRPELSGIILSLVDEQGRPRARGILSLGEIYNLRLPAELAVLSACRTALGKDVKGEGLVGLTRGFMYAGAARVIASLWQADDEATAELMRLMYEGMLGRQRLRPAEALRQAQLQMWRRGSSWSAPYFWAAFTLQGEWQSTVSIFNQNQDR